MPAGVYTLSLPGIDKDEALTGDLDITEKLSIFGTGVRETTIDAGRLDRAFDIMADMVHIRRVTITGGDAVHGGGIYVRNGVFNLHTSRATDNSAAGKGGGIAITGTAAVTIDDSRSITTKHMRMGAASTMEITVRCQ